MTPRSLRVRLLLAAAVSVSLALLAAGAGLTALFERHVTRHLEGQLDQVLGQILAHLDTAPDGRLRLDLHLPDPRFDTPLGGLYWQVEDAARRTLLRSRSLWDEVLELPGDRLPDGALHRHPIPGPAGQSLLALERGVMLGEGAAARPVRAAVALDRGEIRAARRAFAVDILPYLALLGGVLVLAAWVQVQVGLAPLNGLRRGVQAIRAGAARRLSSDHPDEVRPLVEELNALLEAQEGAIERARAWAADLAHGLKTPLTLLAADAERLRALGQPALAEDLDRLAQTMRRRVDRELIRGRMRARLAARSEAGGPGRSAGAAAAVAVAGARPDPLRSSGSAADVGETLESLVRALGRTPRGRMLDWDLRCPAGLRAAVAPEDLTELLGNLLENAALWARSTVAMRVAGPELSSAPGSGSRLGSSPAGGSLTVQIADDGPGVPDSVLPELGRRGLRLDEGAQGSGLGLAIARDICAAYGAELGFGRATLGGLAVCLRLPGVAPAPFAPAIGCGFAIDCFGIILPGTSERPS